MFELRMLRSTDTLAPTVEQSVLATYQSCRTDTTIPEPDFGTSLGR